MKHGGWKEGKSRVQLSKVSVFIMGFIIPYLPFYFSSNLAIVRSTNQRWDFIKRGRKKVEREQKSLPVKITVSWIRHSLLRSLLPQFKRVYSWKVCEASN